MSGQIPRVTNGVLEQPDGLRLTVGGPGWLAWLNETDVRSFAFRDAAGSFTARKERKQHGDGYWVAYRKLAGKLHRVYLGKSNELNLERLHQAAVTLARPEVKQKAAEPNTRRPIGEDSLIHTKLYAPPAQPDLVSRPHLLERLSLGLRGKLTLVCAPAGFGKTTLLAAWRAETPGREMPLAWVSLEADDNLPGRFWRYVCAALEGVWPGCSGSALALLRAGRDSPIEPVLTELLNGVAGLDEDAVLVLDDYHLIDAAPIHKALAFLLEHLPPRLHLVLLSRAEPPLPLTRLRAQNALLEFRAQDLRFTPEETAAFMGQKGLSLPATELAILAGRAEGWVAGLQLAALSMQGRQELGGFVRAFAGSHRLIVDYLAEEVLARQPDEARAFLLETALLERLCGPLCDAVTGRGDGQAMLERLEASNLFLIPLDDERHWYRYHHLFAEFLQNRLRHQRPDVTQLHQKAARWLEEKGFISNAVHHLRAAENFTEVARLVEQQLEWAIEHGEFQTLLNWIEAIPESEARLRPRLYAFRALMVAWVGRLDEAEKWLDRLEAVLDTSEKSPEREVVRAEWWAVRAGVAGLLGDVPRTLEFSRQALGLLPPEERLLRLLAIASMGRAQIIQGHPRQASPIYVEARTLAESAGLTGMSLFFHSLEGYAHLSSGQLQQAVWHLQEVLRWVAQTGESYPSQISVAQVCLGEALCEWNQLTDAAHHLRHGLAVGQYSGNLYFFVKGSLALARVQQAQGNAQDAWETLKNTERIVQQAGQPQLLLVILAARALLQLRQGQSEAGIRWFAMSGLGVEDLLEPEREFEYRVLARVLISQGDHLAALYLLERLRVQAESQERLSNVIELLALEALAHQAKGDKTRASASINRALALAKPEGFVRVFLDEDQPMMALLTRALEAFQRGGSDTPGGVSARYLNSLLATSDLVRESPSALPEALSRRELEVLRMIARGLPNKGVARQLGLETGTVKWYINTLYSKLEVHSRTQAIARANQLGLL